MKKIILLFMVLLSVFFTSWGVKANTPINRPSNLNEADETPWYENRYTSPKASEEWYLDPEIEPNYIPVPGQDELYMVVDDSGNIIKYRKRTKQMDGTWVWEDVNPDIPENYEAVEGLENVYKVTDEAGNVSYFIYVRNDDDTFCFVPCDENGVPLDEGTDATVVEDNYVHVDDNVYAVYNENNVLTGYRERAQTDDGGFVWKVTSAPALSASVGNGSGWVIGNKTDDDTLNTSQPTIQGSGGGTFVGNDLTRTVNSDGSYVEVETTYDTQTENGYNIKYQTIVTKLYSADGELLSTKKEGPYEVERTSSGNSVGDTNTSLIASTLDGEIQRLSSKVSLDTEAANEVLAKLNAERINRGKSALIMDTGSDVYKLACVRAMEMAVNNHASSESPLYGTLGDMIAMWNVSASNPSENIWKTSTVSPSDIHTRFQANEGSRNVRMSNYTAVGIGVVNYNDQTYIAEIYLY